MVADTTCSAHGVTGAAAAVTTGAGTAAATTGSVVAGAVIWDAAWPLLAADNLECADEVDDVEDAVASAAGESDNACTLEPVAVDVDPVLVWAETVVLSSAASLLVVVDFDDDDDDDEAVAVEVDDEAVAVEVVVEGDAVSSVTCSVGALDPAEPAAADDPFSPSEEPPEAEPVEAEPVEDEPASSARATPTSGAASDAPNSAALTPAEAAPICSHRRTPKFSDRRAGCAPRSAAVPPAIS